MLRSQGEQLSIIQAQNNERLHPYGGCPEQKYEDLHSISDMGSEMEDIGILKMESLICMFFRENNFTSGTCEFGDFKMIIYNKLCIVTVLWPTHLHTCQSLWKNYKFLCNNSLKYGSYVRM